MTRPTDEQNEGPTLLAGAQLRVGFPGGPDVLVGASIDVHRSQRVVMLGANGSGKTTLLRTLSGALKPRSGQVRRQGRALAHNRRELTEHRQLVQLVLQDPDDQLFSAEVSSDVAFGPTNLGLPPEQVGARVDEALELLAITDLADRPAHHLSFGQRKRVALAGAVAMRPEVLLLDEPTAGLDPIGVDTLMSCLQRLEQSGTTVVLSTHDVDLAWSWADEVAVVADGLVVQLPVADGLQDETLLGRTGLRMPWQVSLLRGLNQSYDVGDRPRSVGDVTALLLDRTAAPHA